MVEPTAITIVLRRMGAASPLCGHRRSKRLSRLPFGPGGRRVNMTESLLPDEADTATTAPGHLATVRHAPPPRIGEVAVSVHHQEDVVVLTVTGDLDMATAPQMGSAAKRALGSQPRVLVLDL